jgi:hypothetical protein
MLNAGDCRDDSADTTVECDSDDQDCYKDTDFQLIMNFPLLCEKNLLIDLEKKSSVRWQVKNNLSLCKYPYREILLRSSILCIGTGLNIDRIKHDHARPTFIQDIDICMDMESKFAPHFQRDCFELEDVDKLVLNHRFGIIFFAHVGAEGLPCLKKIRNSMLIYYNLLVNEGLFVYNSAVVRETTIDEVIKNNGLSEFEELAQKWRTLLSEFGFIDIIILKKDESEFFISGMFSMLVIAKKAR